MDVLEPNFSWQVSDCLSTNFFCELAEHLVLAQITPVWKLAKIPMNRPNFSDTHEIFFLRTRRASCPCTNNSITETCECKHTFDTNGEIYGIEDTIFVIFTEIERAVDFLEWQFFLTSLRLFVEKIFWDPAEHPVLAINMEFWKPIKLHTIPYYLYVIWCKIQDFVVFTEIESAEDFLELQFFLTSLRLFVKKNYLRSRRAPCPCNKYGILKTDKITYNSLLSVCYWV